MSTSIAPTNFLTTANYVSGSVRTPAQTLDQDDFLKLVTAQMTSQDPLNPKSDTEFIAQMTQFSALEQSKALQHEMATLQASSLLGREVTLQEDDQENTLISGTVSAITMEAGTPQLVVNGQSYDLNSLVSIRPAPTSNTSAQ